MTVKILCVLGQHNYGNPERGHSYEYENFLPAFRRLGHQVIFFESFSRTAYRDFADLNRRLLETIQAENPDIVLCVLLGFEIWAETFELIRKGSRAVLINWSTDDSWKYEQFSRFVAPAFHLYATTYRSAMVKSARDGQANFVLTQWAANADKLAEPLPARACRYQVSFIGSSYGNRPKWVTALKKNGVDIACFGHGWKNGPIPSDQIPKVIRESVISLNFGDSGLVARGLIPTRSRQIKARVFEVPGSGGFLMTEDGENLDRFYDIGNEIVVFEGVSDLVRKIAHFLGHLEERDRIAAAGHFRTRSEHTYDERFRHLLNLAQQLAANPPSSRAPGEVHKGGVDFERFGQLEKSHRPGTVLKALKWILVLPLLLLWGRRRGPRAARRLLFELSWRMAGKKTYSVSGWPGRLFYRES